MPLRLSALLLGAVALTSACTDRDVLWDQFQHPSDAARTKVWWFHGETETTEEGIDADLAAFKEKGVGGVVFYDQVHGKGEGAAPSMSPEWWHMLKYAARRAQALGLSFEVAVSNGYVAGGPWITPELGMQQLVAVDTVITLAGRQDVCLPLSHPDAHFRPVATLLWADAAALGDLMLAAGRHEVRDGAPLTLTYDAGAAVEVSAVSYLTNPRGKGSTGSMNIPGPPQERYFGAGYVDLPPIGELEYSADGRTWQRAAVLTGVESVIGYKSKERSISFPAVRGRYFRVRLHDWMDAEGRFRVLQVADVRLSRRDRVDNWQVKSGLRTEVVYPHPEGGSRGAIAPDALRDVSAQTDADGTLRLTLEAGTWHVLRFGHTPTGGRTKHGRKNLLGLEADVMSAEAMTVHYNHYFKPICDTLAAIGCRPAGMAMDSHEAGVQNWTSGFGERFRTLRGYDLTPWLPALMGYIVGDRASTERVLLDFRRTVAETIATEGYGTLAALCAADGVDFTHQSMLNIDADNILNRAYGTKPQGEFWAYQTDGNYDCLDAASAAHLYGHPIASGEAFTDTPYGATWDELLRIANLAYCRGINEFVVCASSYQPWLDRKYDDDASAHPYVFHRHHPEWASVGPFWEYQARCTQLLREGRPVVDLCVYIGEDVPLKTFAYRLPELPEGYNFDVCTRDALMHRFSARGGRLAVEGGMDYAALVVQDRTYLSPEVVERLEALERDGVPVVWCNRGERVADGLRRAGIVPDLSAPGSAVAASDADRSALGAPSANVVAGRLCFFHRRTDDGTELYFIYNHSPRPYDAPVTLRTDRRRAEVWDARTVTRAALPMAADGSIQLRLEPYQSAFVVVW